MLTGLPNRALLVDRLTRAIVRSKRAETDTAVLFLDLDRFTWVNDSLGHDAGDKLLVAVADRLRPQLRSEDTIARFSGDEFVVLCEGLRFGSDAIHTADRLMAALSVPFHLADRTIPVTASIGIAHASTTPEESAGEILRDADSAMHRAKEGGGNRMELFDEGMHRTAMARLEMESALRRGIDEHRFKVFYQPIIEVGTGRVVGTEALVRWDRGDGDLVAPELFIPLAEETGLIVPIGGLVLREACRQTMRWNETICHDQPVMVAVNISPRQIASAGLVTLVAEVWRKAPSRHRSSASRSARPSLWMTPVPVRSPWLNSKTSALTSPSMTSAPCTPPSGTSAPCPSTPSRSTARSSPVLATILPTPTIVNGVLGLARSLGMRTVAEGVEHPAQAIMVSDLGCEFAQGFLWSKPVPATAFAQWLEERRDAPVRTVQRATSR